MLGKKSASLDQPDNPPKARLTLAKTFSRPPFAPNLVARLTDVTTCPGPGDGGEEEPAGVAEDVPRLLVSPHHAGRGAGGHAALHADRLALHGADTEVLRSDCHRGAVCRDSH